MNSIKGKTWIKFFVSFSIIFIIFLGAFNYQIDSLRLVNPKGLINKNGFIERATNDLSNKKIIAGLGNYNERIFNKRMIEKLTNNLDMLVLGASRSMLIRDRNMTKEYTSFYNASVSNGIFGDFLNFIYIYEYNIKRLPTNIIISIDPWLFNINNPEDRYQDMNVINAKMSNKINIKSNIREKNKLSKFNDILKIFSFEYFKVNMSFLFKTYKSNNKGYYILSDINDGSSYLIKEPDGSLHYPKAYNIRSIEEITNEANTWLKTDIVQFHNFNKLSNIKLFENLLKYLVLNNVKVTIHLSPFNPIIYNQLIIKYPLITEVESLVNQIASKLDIAVLGSYNPSKYSLGVDDFTDYMHPKEDAINKIISKI